MKEIISNNFNININKEDISPPSYVTKELISNSFSININKLEDIPPTVVEKEVISNSFNININKTSIPIDIPVESISVNPNLKDVFVGDVFQIGYTITPSNATNKDVVFSSNNRSVATVNANTGVVEAKGVGECNITCTTVDGNKSDICTVTVREKAPEKIPVQSVSITPKQLNLTVGEFHTFSYIIVPENATNKSVVFVSDNIEIATINGNTVTAVTEGSCKVYVRTLDGNKEDVCDLTVISNEIEGENTPPILSVVFVSSERPDGSYVLNYSVINKDQDEITHKLKIDNSEFTTINPNQDGIYCTYNGTGLTAGEHTGYIQISDGENTVTSKKFIINIPIETESIKEQLKLAKDNYDIKHDNLKNVINSIIEDRVFDEEAEGYILDNAFNEYNIALAKHREISQKAIDSIANKKSHDLKDKFNKDIIDINFAVNGLENTMNGAFKDGILTESEKLSIKQHLLILSSEKSDIDKQYETMFANEHLEGQPKTDLSTAYNSYVLAYNSLVTVINNILEKGGLIDSTDRNKLNNAFKEHDSKLGLYSTNATNALDAIAKKKAEVESAKVDKKYAEIILDPETGIVSKVEHINQELNGTGGLVERVSSAESKITDQAITNVVSKSFYTKSETESAISSKGYQTASQVQQTVNGLQVKVSNSGGYNLIYNGNFKKGMTNWGISGDSSKVSIIQDASCSANPTALCFVGVLSTSNYVSQSTSWDSNESITLSYWQYTSSDGSDGTTDPFRATQVVLGYTDGTHSWHTDSGQTKFNTWEKRTNTITPNSGKRVKSVQVDLWCRDTTKRVYYTNVMLEKGALATEYTPNPNEIYDGITTIDKDGIKVTATNTDTYTEMDASSFRVSDNNGGTVAEFAKASTIPYLKSGTIEASNVYANNIPKKENYGNIHFIYVNGSTGNDTNDGSQSRPYKTVQRAIEDISDIQNTHVTIYVYNSVPGFTIRGFTGSGMITLSLQDSAVINGGVWLHGVTNLINITNETGSRKPTFKAGLAIDDCRLVDIYAVTFRGTNGAGNNISIHNTNYCAINSCDLGGLSTQLTCAIGVHASLLWLHGCIGSNITDVVGQYAYSHVMMARGETSNVPDYSNGLLVNYDGAGRIQNWMGGNFVKTPSSGWNPSYTPTQKTQVWSFNKIWSDETLHGWSDRQELIQGYSSTWNTGRWTGYMQMTDGMASIRNTISGGTNLSGRIYVQRTSSSGNSTGSKLCLYASDGTLITNSTSINRSQGVWVSLSSSIIQKIQSGAITYFYLKADANNNSTYFKCQSNAKIEITYTN